MWVFLVYCTFCNSLLLLLSFSIFLVWSGLINTYIDYLKLILNTLKTHRLLYFNFIFHISQNKEIEHIAKKMFYCFILLFICKNRTQHHLAYNHTLSHSVKMASFNEIFKYKLLFHIIIIYTWPNTMDSHMGRKYDTKDIYILEIY